VSDPGKVFQELPIRVFLDTNVVQNVLVFGQYIYLNHLSKPRERQLLLKGERFRGDIESLKSVLTPVSRSPVQGIISELTIEELHLTANRRKRKSLEKWGFKLLEYSASIAVDVRRPRLTAVDGWLTDFIPSRNDRRLLYESLVTECQAFITMDYHTILRFRELLRKEGLRVLSPTEYWDALSPWWRILTNPLETKPRGFKS
jgi:hypothetical protein